MKKRIELFVILIVLIRMTQLDAQYIVHHFYAQNPSFDSIQGNEPSVRNRGCYEIAFSLPLSVTFVADSGGVTTVCIRVLEGTGLTDPTGDRTFGSVDPTWTGGYFQMYNSFTSSDTISEKVWYGVNDRCVFLSFPSSIIDSVSVGAGSNFTVGHHDSSLGPLYINDVGYFNSQRLPVAEKLQTPVLNSISVNANGEMVLDAVLDPRSDQHVLMVRPYELELLERKFSGTCGIDSADTYGFSNPNDLNLTFTGPGQYYVTILSLSDSGGISHSNVPMPMLLTIPVSVFAPVEQPTIVGHSVTDDSIYIDVEFDSRFVATGTGKCKVSVIADDGGSYFTDPTISTMFFGVLPTMCKVFQVNSVVSDSIARFVLGSFDPGTQYVISARCSDPNVLYGTVSPDAVIYNVATTLSTVVMVSPDSCEIVSAMELVVDGNVHSSLQITLEELVGVNSWSQIFQTTFTDASPQWSSRDGDITLSFTGYPNNSYRWKVGTRPFVEFALNEVSVHSTCGAIQLDAQEMFPQAVNPGQNVRFRADVLGDTSGSQVVMAELENLTIGSPATQHYLSHVAGGLYELNTSFPDTGLYQVRFEDTISHTYSQTVVFVVRDICVGQSVTFDSVSHVYPNLLGICDTVINAPFLGLVTDIAGACPERCDTTNIDVFCSGDGNYITIQSLTHPDYFFRFTNLNEASVAEGDLVRPGETVGIAGNTGDLQASNMEMLRDSAGQIVDQTFVMDAQCPEMEALLAIDQALLLNATPGNITAAATVVNWSQGFFYGVVEIVVYNSGLQKSASSQVIGSQAVFLEAGEKIDLTFTNNISLTGNHIAVIRYRAQEDTWSNVAAQSGGRRNAAAIDMSRVLGVEETTSNALDVKVYPNPVGDILNVIADVTDLQYEVFDITGHRVITGQLNGIKQINTTELVQGVYILRLSSETNAQSSIIRVVKR